MKLILILCSIVGTVVHADGNKPSDTEAIRNLLNNYDWRQRPPGSNGTTVTVNMYISNMVVRPEMQEVDVLLTLRQQWNDPRLAFNNKYEGTPLPRFVILASGDPDQKVWTPDTFIYEVKEYKRNYLDHPSQMTRIYSNGDVFYSRKLMGTFYGIIPFDGKLDINLSVASYAYTTDDITYVWKEAAPVQLKQGLYAHMNLKTYYELTHVNNSNCNALTATGLYSCLTVSLTLEPKRVP